MGGVTEDLFYRGSQTGSEKDEQGYIRCFRTCLIYHNIFFKIGEYLAPYLQNILRLR